MKHIHASLFFVGLSISMATSVSAQANLFTNGDFETGPLVSFGSTTSGIAVETSPGNSSQIPGWQFSTQANAYGQADVAAHAGNNYLIFQRGSAGWATGTGINSGWGTSFAPAVQESRVYKLTADIKAPGTSYAGGGAAGQNVSLILEYRPSNFASSTLSTRTLTYATTANWQTIGYTTASPSSAAYIRTLIQLAASNTSVAIDNLRFEDVTFDANRLVYGDFNSGSLLGWKKTSANGSFWHNATMGVSNSGVAQLRNTSNQDVKVSLESSAFVSVLSDEENLSLSFSAYQAIQNQANGVASDKRLSVTIRQYDSGGSLISELVTQEFAPGASFSTFELDLPKLSISASFLDVEFSLNGSGAIVDYFIDNISLSRASNIPETSHAALLAGLFGAVLLAFRHFRQHR